MLPTLLHRSFPSDKRLKLTFVDDVLAPIFIVYNDSKIWLDTNLLLTGSHLGVALATTHYSMLKPHLATHGGAHVSLSDAYNHSPTTRSLGFTLHVTTPFAQRGKPVALDVRYHRYATRIMLPPVVRIGETDQLRASLALMEWELQNDHPDDLTA